ncbi:MAG: cupredoxin domain-containing protein [Gemmatimonadaceae bacterium]
MTATSFTLPLRKKTMRLLGALCAGTLLLTACGGSDDGGPGPTPQQTLGEIRAGTTTLNLTAGGTSTIQMTALDTQGGTISNPGTYTFTSRSATIVEVNQQGAVVGIGAGTSAIDVSLTRGGVTKAAVVNVTVTGSLGLTAQVAAGSTSNTFQPQVVAVARTGSVSWSFGSVNHNVTFSGGGGAPANIPTVNNTSVSRTFNTAGNFPYDCTLHAGMVGTVIVR